MAHRTEIDLDIHWIVCIPNKRWIHTCAKQLIGSCKRDCYWWIIALWLTYLFTGLNTLVGESNLQICLMNTFHAQKMFGGYQGPTLGAHAHAHAISAHAHGFWVGMGAILLFMGEHGCDIIKLVGMGLWTIASDSERSFICPIQPRLGVGG